MLVAPRSRHVAVLVDDLVHVVKRVALRLDVPDVVGIETLVFVAVKRLEERPGAVRLRRVISELAEPLGRVGALPQVEEAVDVAVVQPEDGIERRHGDRAHVSVAGDEIVPADEVLWKSQSLLVQATVVS